MLTQWQCETVVRRLTWPFFAACRWAILCQAHMICLLKHGHQRCLPDHQPSQSRMQHVRTAHVHLEPASCLCTALRSQHPSIMSATQQYTELKGHQSTAQGGQSAEVHCIRRGEPGHLDNHALDHPCQRCRGCQCQPAVCCGGGAGVPC